MLKISKTDSVGNTTVLKLEGQVIGPWSREVRKHCESVLEGGRKLVLDVGEISFLDVNGVSLFRELEDRGVSLLNVTPFFAEQIKANGRGPGGEEAWSAEYGN